MQAKGIDVFGHKTAKALDNFLDRNGERFDYVLIDTPGEVTSIVVHFVGWSDLVISPIQPSRREVLGAIDCFEPVLQVNETRDRFVGSNSLYFTQHTVPYCTRSAHGGS